MSGAIHVSCEDGCATIILDSPPLNILTRARLSELRVALMTLAQQQRLRVLVLSARGKHFSAGADVAEHLPPEWETLIPEFIETCSTLARFPLPVIAAVHGRCLGGALELVLAADIVLAGESAVFGQPEVLLGVVPPVAAAWLPFRVAHGVGAELIFTGDPITAAEAERVGLVRRVVPDSELEAAVRSVAARISRHSAAALRVAKQSLRAAQEGAQEAALEEAGRLYRTALMATDDALEGLRGFLEKRQPVWSHR